MGIRPRSIGLSRNQSVPSILSTINGRKVEKSSPHRASPNFKAALSTHRQGQFRENDENSARECSLAGSSPSDSLVKSKVTKTRSTSSNQSSRTASPLADHSDHESGDALSSSVFRGSQPRRPIHLSNDSQGKKGRSQRAVANAVFNPPPASSESEGDSDDAGGCLPSSNKASGANLLADTESEDNGVGRGDLRPTKFTSRKSRTADLTTTRELASQTVNASGERDIPTLGSSQPTGLSQPTSSAGSHLETALGHVRKHKAKQTYRKPKPQSTGKKVKQLEKHDLLHSPVKARATFKPPDDSDDLASPKPRKPTLSAGADLDSDTDSRSKALKTSRRKRKGHSGTANIERGEKKVKATLFIPEGSPDQDLTAAPSGDFLHPPSSSSLSDLASSDNETDRKVLSGSSTLCPWCGKTVKPGALKDFAKGRRLNVQMQTRFCRSHQKQAAKDDWKERGYPEINWATLPDRLARHHDFLLEIIDGKSTFFREALAEDIRQGKSRTLRQEENMNPGYYGPRGFNLMCDFLVSQFGDLLKEKAVGDRVIAGRGSAAFIQTVLLADLAVELIKEDLGVGEAEARAILLDSKELGEFVHEEP